MSVLVLFFLGCVGASAPAVSPSGAAVAVAGSAPDDGPGIYLLLGGGPPTEEACTYNPGDVRPRLVLATEAVSPGVLVVPSPMAEAVLRSDTGAKIAPDRGFIQILSVGEGQARGRYDLSAGEHHEAGSFDASACGDLLGEPARRRAAVSLDAVDLAAREGSRVTLEGFLIVHDGVAIFSSEEHETLPPRPAGKRLTIAPGYEAAIEALTVEMSDRVRAARGRVVIDGQLRGGQLHPYRLSEP